MWGRITWKKAVDGEKPLSIRVWWERPGYTMTVVHRVGDTALSCDPGCSGHGHRHLEGTPV